MPSVEYARFKETLAQSASHPLYVLFGEEEFFLDEGVRLLKRKLLGPEGTGSVRWFDGRETARAEILDELLTEDLFSPQRLIIVEHGRKLVEAHDQRRDSEAQHGRSAPKAQNRRSNLDSYLAHPTGQTFLVVTIPLARAKDKPNLSTALKKSALLVRCRKVYDNQLGRWTTSQMRDMGYRLRAEATQLLVDYVGSDLFRLNSELEKLCAYVGERREVNVEDISALVGASPASGIFGFSDALFEKNLESALLALRHILHQGQFDFSRFLGFLTAQFRRLYDFAALRHSGLSQEEARAQLKLPPFVAGKLERQRKYFTAPELAGVLTKLVQLDLSVKTSALSAATALEMLVLELCQPQESAEVKEIRT